MRFSSQAEHAPAMKFFLTRILLLVAVLFTGPAAAQQSLGIAAVVNDEIVSALDLNRRLTLVIRSSRLRDSGQVRRRLAPQVLRNLVSERLKLQEAKRLNIRVTRQDMERAFKELERQRNLPEGGLDTFLKQAGINKAALAEQVEVDIAWGKVVALTMRGNFEVTDEEIDEMLAELRRNEGKPELRVFEIFIPLDDPQNEGQAVILADRLGNQLKAGADFPSLARSFSQNPSSALGGDLGWIRPGQLGGRLDTALAAMKPGDVSSAIRTLTGYTILKLAGQRTAKNLGSTEMTLNIQQFYLDLGPNPGEADIRRQFVRGARLGAQAQSCQDLARIGQEKGSRLSGNLGTVPLNSLPEEMRKTVRDLDIGVASPPIRLGDGIAILMVCQRQGDPTGISERDRVESLLVANRMGEAARRRLRDLLRGAFVEMRL